MKRIFSILAIAAMFAFASCGDKADKEAEDQKTEQEAQSEAEKAEQEMQSEQEQETSQDQDTMSNDGADAGTEGESEETPSEEESH